MSTLLTISARLLVVVGWLEIVFGVIVLAGIVVTILVQIALNAGLGAPIAWEQEGGAYALVWLTFIGAPLALKEMRHVALVGAVSALPPRPRAAIRALAWAIVIWLMVMLMRELGPVMMIEGRAKTVALPINVPRSWFFSVPLLVSSALMAWTATHYFLASLVELCRADPGEPGAVMPADAPGIYI